MKHLWIIPALILSVADLSACKTGDNRSAAKDFGSEAGAGVSIAVVDDSHHPVSQAQLRSYGSNNDGSTMFTYTFTATPMSGLDVAVWVWNAAFGADKPHDAGMDANGNLRGQAGRIAIFNMTQAGGSFQIIPNDVMGSTRPVSPLRIVDDHGKVVPTAALKTYGMNNDGSTIFTYTLTGGPMSDLEVASWVWSAVWGAAPHAPTMDAYSAEGGASFRARSGPLFRWHGGGPFRSSRGPSVSRSASDALSLSVM